MYAVRLVLCAISVFTLAFASLKSAFKENDPYAFDAQLFLYTYNFCSTLFFFTLAMTATHSEGKEGFYLSCIIALASGTFLNVRLCFFIPKEKEYFGYFTYFFEFCFNICSLLLFNVLGFVVKKLRGGILSDAQKKKITYCIIVIVCLYIIAANHYEVTNDEGF